MNRFTDAGRSAYMHNTLLVLVGLLPRPNDGMSCFGVSMGLSLNRPIVVSFCRM